MILDSKPVAAISEADLQALLDQEIAEGRFIDYKRDLPGTSDADRKEFLFDVSSFANASGGYLIYGIEEEDGIAKQLTGVSVANPDQELLRLQSLILDGIEPRISGLELRFIPIAGSTHVLVVRVPKSWQLPHMVIFKGTDKFYSRNNGGKYRLDVGELRSLFTLSSAINEKIRKFRIERLGQIVADETPFLLATGPKTVLHLVPFQSFSSTTRIDLSTAARFSADLLPLGSSGYNPRVNLDGLLHHNGVLSNMATSYLQLFHNGIIETVDVSLLSANADAKLIPSTLFERKIMQHIIRYLSAYQKLGIDVPVVVMLSLLAVKGYEMATGGPPTASTLVSHPGIDRDTLILPEIILEKFNIIPRDLKPILDSVWNAAGWYESKNFDAEGNYTPR